MKTKIFPRNVLIQAEPLREARLACPASPASSLALPRVSGFPAGQAARHCSRWGPLITTKASGFLRKALSKAKQKDFRTSSKAFSKSNWLYLWQSISSLSARSHSSAPCALSSSTQHLPAKLKCNGAVARQKEQELDPKPTPHQPAEETPPNATA